MDIDAELENMHIEVNLGLGEITMEPVEFDDGVPTIVIHKLKEPVEPNTFIPKDSEHVGIPIMLKFHSMDAIMYMYRMLAPLVCEYHMRALEERSGEQE